MKVTVLEIRKGHRPSALALARLELESRREPSRFWMTSGSYKVSRAHGSVFLLLAPAHD
jgi:hypothetical protein